MTREKGKRICQRCRKFYKKENLKMSRYGRVCEACNRELEKESIKRKAGVL